MKISEPLGFIGYAIRTNGVASVEGADQPPCRECSGLGDKLMRNPVDVLGRGDSVAADLHMQLLSPFATLTRMFLGPCERLVV